MNTDRMESDEEENSWRTAPDSYFGVKKSTMLNEWRGLHTLNYPDQPFVEEKAIPWKEANDTVYRRGGWRAYAKEAAAGSNDDAQPASGADPHAGHSMPMPMPMPMPKKEQR